MKKCGILLPIFSLPNKYGIGTLGKSAYKFIDFLKLAKQNYWQILPINPTTYGDSPYQSFSCFAFNPYFIDLDLLVNDGLITKKELLKANLINKTPYIDYGNLFNNKLPLLKKAYKNKNKYLNSFNYFKKNNKWLKDYALFMALKEKFSFSAWYEWPNEYKYKNEKILKKFSYENRKLIDSIKFIQFLAFRQWHNLKKYAKQKNIEIIGDMPIYVAYDSVDVWSNPKLFLLDEKYNPTLVAGVPPDYFSNDGQLWGNPLYNYDEMSKDGYMWWVNRVYHSTKLFDYVRIDHFRGFAAYYCIPYGDKTAKNGYWQQGPKMELFKNIKEKLNNPKIIAENLGLLDDDVFQLIEKCDYPGMRILQFEMYSKENLISLKNANPNNILYPGTHDNNTFKSWLLNEANPIEKENTIKELKIKNLKYINNYLIKYCYSFPFDTVIISLQDILGLDEHARINTPGTCNNNWTFMFKIKDFQKNIALKLAKYKKYSKSNNNL